MSELADAQALVDSWLQPLPDESAPCGPDLEYDNEFLDLSKAVAGKPESQFGPAEPPDWRAVVAISGSLFERSRDLRVAIEWMRGNLRLHGYGALPVGLKLINGLIENFWDHLHPMPDPDDGDPYGRVNALTLLREHVGALGDLRESRISEDRSIGILKVADIEAALAAPGTAVVTSELTKEQATKMLAATVEKMPELRAVCTEAVVQVKALIAAANDKLGQGTAPDLRPLYTIVNGVAGLLPAETSGEAGEEGEGEAGEGGDEGSSGGGRRGKGLSGTVNTREEALKAIDLVIEFLERTEPTNPAPLFLRRARQLVGHNFLQLMKVLAPDALAEVARIVGVDPETVLDPDAEA